jgi:hypothetical protein
MGPKLPIPEKKLDELYSATVEAVKKKYDGKSPW